MRPENAMAVPARERAWRLALALVPGLVLVLLRGVDSNWDLRNYHLYNPHAWLSGRLLTDVAPAQLQSWHNPLLDLPLYLLTTSGLDLRWASVWLTLPFAAAIYQLLKLQGQLSPTPPGRGSQVVLALLALSGAATWSTIGNSMNDGFVAAAVLGALGLLAGPHSQAPRSWLLAGLLAGAVMGLKLTASSYCLALAAAALLGVPGPWRAAGTRLLFLASGGLLGFALTWGWWGWKLQQLYGNPLFPYFNDLFASAWAPAGNHVDARFRADGLLDALAIPFQLLRDGVERSELRLRDPRLLFGALGLPALAWRLRSLSSPLAGPARGLAVFFWVALLAWGLQYGIYRYAAPLELLGTLALVLWLVHLPYRGLALALALVLVSKATHRPDWGHLHQAPPRYALTAAPLPDDALVIVASGDPLAYVALGLPSRVPMISVNNNLLSPGGCSRLEQRARALIAGHTGSFWLLSESAASADRDAGILATGFGLEREAEPPRIYANALGDVVFSRVRPVRAAGACGARH